MNARSATMRPGDLGIDLMHFNLHKTFATPHGGGGPGSGPLAASERLEASLPGPLVAPTGEGDRPAFVDPPKSIGRMRNFHSNFGALVRAWAYIRLLGADGLRDASMHAVSSANDLCAELRDHYAVPFDRATMHEFVCRGDAAPGAHAIDVCTRLMDHGFHPPTSYFPLTVPEALMIEPTESLEMLGAFASAMRAIAQEAERDPDSLRSAPHDMPVRGLGEVGAARHPVLRERISPGKEGL